MHKLGRILVHCLLTDTRLKTVFSRDLYRVYTGIGSWISGRSFAGVSSQLPVSIGSIVAVSSLGGRRLYDSRIQFDSVFVKFPFQIPDPTPNPQEGQDNWNKGLGYIVAIPPLRTIVNIVLLIISWGFYVNTKQKNNS